MVEFVFNADWFVKLLLVYNFVILISISNLLHTELQLSKLFQL